MPIFTMTAVLFLLLPQPPAKPPAGRTVETLHLAVTTSSAADTKTTRSLFVDVDPKPRMHVYAPGQDGYIAVTLTLQPDPAFRGTAARFPPAEKLFFQPLNETQLVYSKPFRIVQPVTLSRERREPLTIKGTLRYQACDDKVCYPPKSIAIEWRIAPKTV